MIEQYLPQTNESITVAKSKKFSHLNKTLVYEFSWHSYAAGLQRATGGTIIFTLKQLFVNLLLTDRKKANGAWNRGTRTRPGVHRRAPQRRGRHRPRRRRCVLRLVSLWCGVGGSGTRPVAFWRSIVGYS